MVAAKSYVLIVVMFMAIVTAVSAQSANDSSDALPFEPGDTLEDIRFKIDYNGYDFSVDHNWVFDMSPEEKELFYSRKPSLSPVEFNGDIGPVAKFVGNTTLPTSFDWRSVNGHSYIGAVRNQGSCGSCYSFGANAAAEGTYNYANGLYDSNCVDFSESYIIWCLARLSAYSSHFSGCNGADYDYMELTALCNEGITYEANFPYQQSDPGSCTHWNDPTVSFQNWYRVGCNDIEAIKTAIMTYGVVDAAVYVDSAFEAYSGGIYSNTSTSCTGSPCYNTTTNHAISLVGWNDNGGNGYWILRNSWGSTSWGEGGYMRISYQAARVACSVAYLVYDSSIPSPTPAPTNTPAAGAPGETCANAGNITTQLASAVSSGSAWCFSVNTTSMADDYDAACSGTCNYMSDGNDAVWKFTPSSTWSFDINNCTAGDDWSVMVYAGSCSGTPVYCDDDSCGGSCSSPYSFTTGCKTFNAGTTYYVVVWKYGGGGGTTSICFSPCGSSPTNTPVPATNTPTRTPTRTPTSAAATNTPTRTPTRTPTSVVPTNTPSTLPGNTCSNPVDIGINECVTGSTVGYANSHDCGTGHAGLDRVYRLYVPSSMSVTFIGEADYDADFTIASSCSSSAGDVGCWDRQGTQTNPACGTIAHQEWGYLNHTVTLSAGYYYIWIDGYYANGAGNYALGIEGAGATNTPVPATNTPTRTPTRTPTTAAATYTPTRTPTRTPTTAAPTSTPVPPTNTPSSGAGNNCSNPLSININDCVQGSTSGFSNSHDCGTGHAGVDCVYELLVPETMSVTFIGEASFDVDWTIASSCSSSTGDIGCWDRVGTQADPSCGSLTHNTYGYMNYTTTLDAGYYYIWVDGYYSTSVGPYSLEVIGETSGSCEETTLFTMNNDCSANTTNFAYFCDPASIGLVVATDLCPTSCVTGDDCRIGWKWGSGDTGIHWIYFVSPVVNKGTLRDLRFDLCYGLDGYSSNLTGNFRVYYRNASGGATTSCTTMTDSGPTSAWTLAWADAGVNWTESCGRRTAENIPVTMSCAYSNVELLVAVEVDAYADAVGIGNFRVYKNSCDTSCSDNSPGEGTTKLLDEDMLLSELD